MRVAKPYQVLSLAWNSAGMSAALGGDQLASIPFSWSRRVLRISLFQNRSQRGLAASRIRSWARPTVLLLSTSNLVSTSTPDCLV